MSKLSTQRSHATAVRAANMKSEGYTTREIADAIGKDPVRVKAVVALGVRILESGDTK